MSELPSCELCAIDDKVQGSLDHYHLSSWIL
jgi:hypothetical protein